MENFLAVGRLIKQELPKKGVDIVHSVNRYDPKSGEILFTHMVHGKAMGAKLVEKIKQGLKANGPKGTVIYENFLDIHEHKKSPGFPIEVSGGLYGEPLMVHHWGKITYSGNKQLHSDLLQLAQLEEELRQFDSTLNASHFGRADLTQLALENVSKEKHGVVMRTGKRAFALRKKIMMALKARFD
jgi:hypothetical protein